MASWTRAARMACAAFCAAAALVLGACANQESSPNASLAADGKGPIKPGSNRDFSVNVGDLVYFASDSSDLTPDAQGTLRKQVQWLRQYPTFTVTIEGHADERGTREYNIALGARRATSVKNFLARSGIKSSRIRTISYGKERPVAVCDDITCWSQNRRAQTVLNSRAAS